MDTDFTKRTNFYLDNFFNPIYFPHFTRTLADGTIKSVFHEGERFAIGEPRSTEGRPVRSPFDPLAASGTKSKRQAPIVSLTAIKKMGYRGMTTHAIEYLQSPKAKLTRQLEKAYLESEGSLGVNPKTCTAFTPMLSATVKGDGEQVKFPVLATIKLDGIRVIKYKGQLVSRSMKPIRNKHLIAELAPLLPEGADGEIIVDQEFKTTTSFVMSVNKPIPPNTKFYWFDYIKDGAYDTPYSQRCEYIKRDMPVQARDAKIKIVALLPTLVKGVESLLKFETKALSEGHEGVIIRSPNGHYKCGRSTVNQGLMMKLKRFTDSEAKVYGYEQISNGKQELGALKLKWRGTEFSIGTGFSASERRDFWKNRKKLVGQLVKFKYFEIGSSNHPRHPVFLGFRDTDDL